MSKRLEQWQYTFEGLSPLLTRSGNAMERLEYPVLVEPLSEEDGGGFVVIVPDLPGCMSDGDTPEEAISNVRGAITAWIEAATDLGRSIPQPSRHLEVA